MSFVIFKLRKIDSQIDSTFKCHWGMSIYMNDIPQTKQNIVNLNSVPLKHYPWSEYSSFPVPHRNEQIRGFYYSGRHKFELTGIVESVFYNTDINCIMVECKCIDIQNLKDVM